MAEVNAQFDTLNSITLNFPPEKINEAEIDSLERKFKKNEWEAIEDVLPNQKTPVENMRIDSQSRFWLKLGYRSDYDQWLIIDSGGALQKIVQLPKGTYLTHISKLNLGVRIGPSTFALYEPVE